MAAPKKKPTIKQGLKKVKNAGKDLAGAAGSLFKNVSNDSAGDQVAQVGKDMKKFGDETMKLGVTLMSSANPIAMVAGVVVTAFGAITKAIGFVLGIGPAIKELGEQGITAGRQLAEMSASMSAVIAERDVNTFFRQAALGDATSDTTARLVASMDALDDALLPIQATLQNAFNNVFAIAIDLLTWLVNFLKPLFDLLTDLYNALSALIKWLTGVDLGQLSKDLKRDDTPSGFPAWLEDSAKRGGFIRQQNAIP